MTIPGASWWVESGQVGSAPKVAKIPPAARLKPDLPNGHENEAREHDGDEGRGVIPQHQPSVEGGGVVVHKIKQGVSRQAPGRDARQSSRRHTIDRRKRRAAEAEARQRIEARAMRLRLKALWSGNICQPTTAKTRMGFFQFMGPASRSHRAFQPGDRIGAISSVSSPCFQRPFGGGLFGAFPQG